MYQVHFLGPKGTFTEIAANKLVEMNGFSDSDFELLPCSNIKEVVNKVDTHSNCMGVVPIENSIEGIVRETLDNIVLSSSKVMITNEVVIKISHCLVTKASRFEQITNIASKNQALAQCKGFIDRNFPQGVNLHNVDSTSEAIKSLSDKDNSWAAIGTKIAANYYDIPILKEGINDQQENFTRFALLSSEILEPSGNDQTSIVLSIRNKPGALFEMLVPFKDAGVNLCRIESRPSKKYLGEYIFFIDFDGHIKDQKVKNTIGKIVPEVDFYKFLGSYPKFSK